MAPSLPPSLPSLVFRRGAASLEVAMNSSPQLRHTMESLVDSDIMNLVNKKGGRATKLGDWTWEHVLR